MYRWNVPELNGHNVYVHNITGEGNCLLEAICHCVYDLYHTRINNNKRVTKKKTVELFRDMIADKLDDTNPNTKVSNYESILGGTFSMDATAGLQYNMEQTKELLWSDKLLNERVVPIIEAVLNISIYLIDAKTKKVRIMTDIPQRRDSIVLLFNDDHYDAISIKNNGIHITKFSYEYTFILFLRSKIMTYR